MTSSDSPGQGPQEFERNVRRMRNEWAAEQARREQRGTRAVASGDRAYVVPFFCECDSVHCHAVVWMTYEAYETLRTEPFPLVLAPDHGANLSAVA